MTDNKYSPDCGSCRFWLSSGMIPGSERGEQQGSCKRHAPQLFSIGTLAGVRWPRTSELDWCGDWEDGIHSDLPKADRW
jgi:hypothetical protein